MSAAPSRSAGPRLPWIMLVSVWGGLMALLALSLGLAFLPDARMALVAGLVIAAAKAGLVAALYMELARAGALVRLAALAGCVFAVIMFGLTFSDMLTRQTG